MNNPDKDDENINERSESLELQQPAVKTQKVSSQDNSNEKEDAVHTLETAEIELGKLLVCGKENEHESLIKLQPHLWHRVMCLLQQHPAALRLCLKNDDNIHSFYHILQSCDNVDVDLVGFKEICEAYNPQGQFQPVIKGAVLDEIICDAVSGNNNFSDILFDKICQCCTIKELDLDEIGVDLDAEHVVRFIQPLLPNLEKLECAYVYMPNGYAALLESLSVVGGSSLALVELSLPVFPHYFESDHDVNKENIAYFKSAITGMKNLKSLAFRATNIDSGRLLNDTCMVVCAQIVSGMATLEKLQLVKFNLSNSESLDYLISTIPETLRELAFNDINASSGMTNNISLQGTCLDITKKWTSMEKIELYNVEICTPWWQSFLEQLPSISSLRELELSDGCDQLFDITNVLVGCIKNCKLLRRLEVLGSFFADAGKVADAVENNISLEEVKFHPRFAYVAPEGHDVTNREALMTLSLNFDLESSLEMKKIELLSKLNRVHGRGTLTPSHATLKALFDCLSEVSRTFLEGETEIRRHESCYVQIMYGLLCMAPGLWSSPCDNHHAP